MHTEPIISVKLVDVTAKKDSNVSMDGNSEFADVLRLKEEKASIPDYMTLEWNYSLLDGSMSHLPDNIEETQYPFFSSEMSNAEGEYSGAYVLDVNFTGPHSSAGVSFSFQGDHPKNIKIVWYAKAGAVLSERNFIPDELDYFCENKVENFYRILVTFEGSAAPYRFLKMENIEYGYELTFTAENVREAKVLEEIDPISSELRINTFDFKIYDPNREFNILNQKGKYSLFQSKQEINAKESVNGAIVDMGTFYLDSKESESEVEISFHALDAVGVIDKTNFVKGKIYKDETAEDIIGDIMASAGWEKYEISDELKPIVLNGYIEICSHREALQQVAFALRAVVDCSRSDLIRIYRQNTSVDGKLKDDRIFIEGEKVSAKEYVSKVDVTMHSYELSSEESTVFDGILSAGLNEVTFSEPVTNIQATAGTIEESGVNYVLIRANSSTECKITGNVYKDVKSTFSRSTNTPESNETEKTVSVDGATLIDKSNAYLVSEHVFDYYSNRRKLNIRYVMESERTGRWTSVKSQYGMYVNGVIESQEIDLAGGYIASASLTGYNTSETDFIYTGMEAYTGERIGVI